MMELSDIRREIDSIDDELVNLLVRRLQATDAIADAKRETGKAVRDSERERGIFAKVSKAAGSDFESDIQTLFETILSVSRARQSKRIGAKEVQ